MPKTFLPLILVLGVLSAAAMASDRSESGQARALDAGRSLIGKASPSFRLKTIDGQVIDLAAIHAKRPIYLKFWATWCIPCRQQMPAFERDFRALQSRMTVIAVNTGFNDNVEAVRSYRRAHGLTMPIVIDDGRLAQALHLRVTPQHVVIGRDGRVLYVGHLEDEALHRALAAALGERAGPPTSADKEARSSRSPLGAEDGDRLDFADGRPRLLWFMSPWCETYLARSRPAMARECLAARQAVSRASAVGRLRISAVASGLWASEKDLRAYRAKTGLRFPLVLDASGAMFRRYGIRQVPALLLIDGRGATIRRLAAGELDRSLGRTLIRN